MSLLPYFKFFLALYFLVAMHVIFDTPGGVGLYFSYNVFAWIITSILIALGLWQITLNQKIYYSNMLIWLTLGCICLIIPVFYQFEFTDHAIPRILALIGGLLFLFSLYQFNISRQETLQLLFLILAGVVIEACFGLVQFFILEEGDWGGYIIGKNRPHGVFLQPNVMASFMATGTAIALFLSVKNNFTHRKILFQSFIGFSLFSSCFLLIILQSRTGLVALAAISLLSAPYLYQKNRKKLLLNIVIISVAIFSAKTCLIDSPSPIRDSEVYQNAGVREEIYIVSFDMIKEKTLVGYGYGGFERGFIDHFNIYAKENPEIGDTITRLSHPHNEVLFWVAEGGVIALLAFILFATGYVLTWKNLPFRKGLMIIALVFPILLHSQLEFPFYSSVAHWLVFLIMLWVLERYALNESRTHKFINCQPTFLIRFLALFIPVIFIPFLITTLHTASILVEHEKSPSKSLEKFNEIINPIAWQSRLDAAVYAHIFISGMQTKDPTKLNSYLAWALKRIRHKPRAILYANCLLILKELNEEEAYLKLLNDAKRTYSNKVNWESRILHSESLTQSNH